MSTEKDTLFTLQRGMAVFEYVASSGPITAKQLARELDLKIGVCYHVLRTLLADGYVVRAPGGRYHLGPHAFALSRSLQRHSAIAPELAVVLTRLHNATNETAYIAEWADGVVMLRHFLAADHAVQVRNLEIGYSGDMHARASCKSVLAFLPHDQLEHLFSGVALSQLTPNTIVDFEELLVELTHVRKRGYALDNEEFTLGMQCVSAPYFDATGQPAGSLTVSVPTDRFRLDKERLIDRVREAAAIATQVRRVTPGPSSRPGTTTAPETDPPKENAR